MNRRLDDRIHELCARATVTRNDDELQLILAELQSALREHGKRMKRTAVGKLVKQDEGFKEKRSA